MTGGMAREVDRLLHLEFALPAQRSRSRLWGKPGRRLRTTYSNQS